jgi:hypothetical protein
MGFSMPKRMSCPRILPAREPILELMISLARCSKQQRIIVAGAKSAELMSELHRRGYYRAVSTAHCGLPAGQYDVAIVDWQQRSAKALATTLDWLVNFLTAAGMLVVWVDPQDAAANRALRAALESHGLAVEAGSIRTYGSAVSARPRETHPISKAA